MFSFTQYTLKVCRCTQNLKNLAVIEICDKKFYWRKNNTGKDKQKDADSLLHDTTSHAQCLYQTKS